MQFGRIGTSGQEQAKEFASDAEAQKAADKLIAEKTRKGYVAVGGGDGECIPPLPRSEKETEAGARAGNSRHHPLQRRSHAAIDLEPRTRLAVGDVAAATTSLQAGATVGTI